MGYWKEHHDMQPENREMMSKLTCSKLLKRVDPSTIFAERMDYRHEAKKAFVHADSSTKVAKAMLRKLETIELET